MKTTIIKTILFLIIFLKSFNLYSADANVIVYFSADCQMVSNNSYEVAQYELSSRNWSLSSLSHTLLPFYGDIDNVNVNSSNNKIPYYSQTPSAYDVPCLDSYTNNLPSDLVAYRGVINVFSVDSDGQTQVMYTETGATFSSFNVLLLAIVKRNSSAVLPEFTCPDGSFNLSTKTNYYTVVGVSSTTANYCSFNLLRFQDPACRNFIGEEFPVLIRNELTEEEKNYPLTIKVTKNLGDPNDPNDNLYCRLDFKEFIENDSNCYHYSYSYTGDSYSESYKELYDLPPDISNYQDSYCEYLLTGESPPQTDPENPDPNNPDPETPDPEQDTDNDGIPDIEDPDIDGDGVNNEEDAFPNDPNESQDNDNDGVGNNTDAFPDDPNEDTDTDGDGIGNNTDTDDDNDGTPDVNDVFPLNPNEDTDTDGDGFGDNSDPDPNTPNSGTGEGETGEENEGDFGLGEMGYDERSFYEPKYPDGLTGVFTDNFNRIMEESSFGEILQSIDISQSIGTSQQYPVYEFEFDLFGEVYTNSIDTSNILDTGINFWVVLNTLLIFLSILTAIKIIF